MDRALQGASGASGASGARRLLDRFPARVWATFRPCPLARSPSRSGQGHFSAQDGPGPPTKAPRAAQDRQQRPQERLKTANIRPRRGQDRPHRGPKSGPRPPTEARQLHDRSSSENIEEKTHRKNTLTAPHHDRLPIDCTTELIAVKR